jgi:hypothetical protein
VRLQAEAALKREHARQNHKKRRARARCTFC